jgi:acyl-CoA synthetase (AMP-forming)/AMP-acid ligase II/acyl carrier protein
MQDLIIHSSFSSLVELLQLRAQEQPDLAVYTFLVDGEKEEVSITCSQLDSQARAIAASLQKLNLQGERALLLYPPGLEYIAAFFGCLYAGVIAVPAYPPDPNRLARTLPRLQAIVKDSQARVVLTTEMIRSMSEFIFSQAPDLAQPQWMATDCLDINLGTDWKAPSVFSETLAFLQYTSGSTGIPKGVMLTHANLLHNLKLIQHAFEVSFECRGTSWLPPYHDMGLIGGILEPLYLGIPTVLMSPIAFLQKPFRWLQAISRYRTTSSGGPNFAYDLCVRKTTPEQRATLDLSSWDLAFCGAEPIRPETIDRFVEAFGPCGFRRDAFYPCYGLAEGTLIVSGGKKGRLPVIKNIIKKDLKENKVSEFRNGEEIQSLVSCGRSLPDQEIVIVQPDSAQPCSSDEIGEIWVKGPSVAQGYWNQPEETKRTFNAYLKTQLNNSLSPSPQPSPVEGEGDKMGKKSFLRTGDLGFLRDDELFVTGRLKDLIIIRGQNHYPQDIELTVERSHSHIRPGCVAVFSVEQEGEEQLVVMCEAEAEDESMVSSIRQSISENHELETSAVVLLKKGAIPKTSSGKISHYACREAFLENKLECLRVWKKNWEGSKKLEQQPEVLMAEPFPRAGDKSQKMGAIQSWLIHQFSTRLGIDATHIDILKPFTSYGLDSKDAINLSGDLEEWLGKSLSPTLMWKYSNIEALARFLSGEESVDRILST